MTAGERAMEKRRKTWRSGSRVNHPVQTGDYLRLGGRLLPLLVGLLILAALPPAPVLAGAYDQLLQMSGGGGSVPDVPPPTCVDNCGGDTRQENSRTQEVHTSTKMSTEAMTLKALQDSIDQMFQLKPGTILKIRDQQVQGAEAVQGAILNQQRSVEARQAQAERDAEAARQKQLADLGNNLQGMPADTTAEGLRSFASVGFDTPANANLPPAGPAGTATPFFGDTMPPADLQTLLNPEGDPRVVDLRQAVTYVVGNLKTNEELAKNAQEKAEKDRRAKKKDADCVQIARKLNKFIDQQNKFHKTILQAQDQVTTWEEQNRNALINQVKDGMEYFIGNYLDVLRNRGLAAERLQRIVERNAANMARDGLDVAAIEAKIQRLKTLSTVGEAAWTTGQVDTWQTFIKDGASSLLAQLRTSNGEIDEMINDPKMQKYFTTDAPQLNLLLDISKIAADCQVFGKWVAKKMPMVALIDISIKTLYNGTDWLLSFQNVLAANEVNGRVMYAAQSLQNHIEETYGALKQCRQ